MVADFRKMKNNVDTIKIVNCFKFLGTIISSELGREEYRRNREKGSTNAVFPAAIKTVRTEEGDSCLVLSFCCCEYFCILNMYVVLVCNELALLIQGQIPKELTMIMI